MNPSGNFTELTDPGVHTGPAGLWVWEGEVLVCLSHRPLRTVVLQWGLLCPLGHV